MVIGFIGRELCTLVSRIITKIEDSVYLTIDIRLPWFVLQELMPHAEIKLAYDRPLFSHQWNLVGGDGDLVIREFIAGLVTKYGVLVMGKYVVDNDLEGAKNGRMEGKKSA
jgi:hypothetical protein